MQTSQKGFKKGVHAPTLRDLGFGGIGRSEQGDSSPVSERHDEALGEALAPRSNQTNLNRGAKQ